MSFVLHLDQGPIKELDSQLRKELTPKLQEAAAALAAQTHAHVVEEASQRLKTRREWFMDNLTLEQVDKNIWAITVSGKGLWIEDGMQPHEMIDDLVKNGKIAADGSKYQVIPFEHSKGQTQQGPVGKQITSLIKQELKSRKIPYMKIERGIFGLPRSGKLHEFSINGPEAMHGKLSQAYEGPVGHHLRSQFTGAHYGQGVRIYQKIMKNEAGDYLKDKKGRVKAERSVVTFRVASTKQKGSGMWFHPGLTGEHFLDEAAEWAGRTWDTQMLPDILKGLGID